MQTRSQTKLTEETNNLLEGILEVNIDFDEASNAWKQNKKYMGNGTYKYICPNQKKDGSKCGKSCYKNSDLCWHHSKMRKQF
jgi:hypothetical protein